MGRARHARDAGEEPRGGSANRTRSVDGLQELHVHGSDSLSTHGSEGEGEEVVAARRWASCRPLPGHYSLRIQGSEEPSVFWHDGARLRGGGGPSDLGSLSPMPACQRRQDAATRLHTRADEWHHHGIDRANDAVGLPSSSLRSRAAREIDGGGWSAVVHAGRCGRHRAMLLGIGKEERYELGLGFPSRAGVFGVIYVAKLAVSCPI